MAQIITMPKLGLTMTSGKITLWLKREGDEVAAGEPVCEIETDKISAQVESPAGGVVLKILAEEWEEKEIAAPLCILGARGEAWESAVQSGADGAGEETPAPNRLIASPAARRLAQERGVELGRVAGTGEGGHIEKKDVERLLEERAGAPGPGARGIAVAKRIPLAGPRKVAADRLSASKRDIPHAYFTVSVDAAAMIDLKREAGAGAAGGKKPTLNDVIVRAAAAALREFPEVNATLAGGEIVCYRDVNIGIAVDTDRGLFVPVIRQADKKSLQEIADAAGELIGRAREGKLAPDDLAGGTFTISNLGAYGVDEFAPVINPPEAAILAVGRAADAPCAAGGELRVRPVMRLTLAVDHRTIDGALAARFLARLKEIMEATEAL
jgi:pyruvate dehydrogenase E2 component (dihydrolipoamide acetyltransferase)